MGEQLAFDLPARPALGRSDFFVAPSNAVAVAMIDRGTDWPGGKLVLTGPKGAGKSHLVHVWAAQTGARTVAATALVTDDVPGLAMQPVAVEDVPDAAGNADAETALFHLHNLMAERGHPLLMTGRAAPSHWPLGLPDLTSRIAAAGHVELDQPDDRLLSAILAKLFADRQILPRPDVIPYLVSRMERSFAAATDIVDRLDRAALSEGRDLTRVLAARWLGAPSDAAQPGGSDARPDPE
jgi:chromosomal replication initiation ATPase DnaA